MPWLIILPSLELGTWIGWLLTRFGSRDRVRARLLYGTRAARATPFIDKRLERDTLNATRMQRQAAAGITRGLRFLAGARAFELAMLKAVQAKWPGAPTKAEVRLNL